MKIFDEVIDINITYREDFEKVRKVLEKYSITQYKMDCDYAFDSPGYDVWSYAISYVYNNELELITGAWDSY